MLSLIDTGTFIDECWSMGAGGATTGFGAGGATKAHGGSADFMSAEEFVQLGEKLGFELNALVR